MNQAEFSVSEKSLTNVLHILSPSNPLNRTICDHLFILKNKEQEFDIAIVACYNQIK